MIKPIDNQGFHIAKGIYCTSKVAAMVDKGIGVCAVLTRMRMFKEVKEVEIYGFFLGPGCSAPSRGCLPRLEEDIMTVESEALSMVEP